MFQLTLNSGSTLDIQPGRALTVNDAATISGLLTSNNGSFAANSPASQFSGNGARVVATGGGQVSIAGTTYTNTAHNGDLITASDAGTSIDLSSIATLNGDKDFGGAPITTIAARNGGSLNLSGLTNVVGGRGGDSLRFEATGGGTLNISGLQSVTGARNVRFTSDGTALDLPSLQTISTGVLFEMASGTALNLPSLTSIDGAGSGMTTLLEAPDAGSLTASSLTNFTRTTLSLGPARR